jgi:hypothetical protein
LTVAVVSTINHLRARRPVERLLSLRDQLVERFPNFISRSLGQHKVGGRRRRDPEITQEAPQKATQHRQVEAFSAALKTILVECRCLCGDRAELLNPRPTSPDSEIVRPDTKKYCS